MTTTYVHLTDGDKPESQTAIAASFVDKDGKHIDIGGGGATEIHTDDTLAGTGTTVNPLKLSETTNSKIAKASTLTEDNLGSKNTVTISNITPLGVYKNSSRNLSIMLMNGSGLSKSSIADGVYALTVPAIPALAAISTLGTSATLPDVVNKVNEILNAVKNAAGTSSSVNTAIADNAITDNGLGEPSIIDSE